MKYDFRAIQILEQYKMKLRDVNKVPVASRTVLSEVTHARCTALLQPVCVKDIYYL